MEIVCKLDQRIDIFIQGSKRVLKEVARTRLVWFSKKIAVGQPGSGPGPPVNLEA